jgi:hypothetical protein
MTIVDPVACAVARGHPVTVLAWPAEADRAARARRQGRAHLLLVDPDAEPPTDRDALTDWVRLPVSDRDVLARLDALHHRPAPADPYVDEHDVLRRGDRWAALSPIEAGIVRALLEHPTQVVSRRDIGAAVWPGAMPAGRPVDGRLPRLRTRIAPLGLRIHTIRRRGFMLAVENDVAGLGAEPV